MVLPFVNPCDYGDPEPCGVNPSFVYTRYPCDFDDPRPTDTRGLPITVDNRTPVKAEVVNRQRESILAIEAEMGIQPSGTFTTVRARLDALEGLLCAIWDRLQDTGSPVNILWNGTSIVSGVENINFTGTGVTITNAGGNQANIDISGGGGGDTIYVCNVDGYMPVHVALPVTVDSQQLFTLPSVPYRDLVILFVEGIKQEIGDYIVTANQLEWLGEDLVTSDVVEAFYTVYGGQGDGYEPVHEALSVDTPGQTVFYLTENPWDELVLLFIEGIKQEISNYTVNGNIVTWTGITPLAITDVVEVVYFKRIPGDNCGSGSILTVADESVIIEENVEIIDFHGIGVTAVGDGAGKVTVTISGASTIMHQEVFSATTSQTAFYLAYAPISQQSTELFIDGVSQTVGTDYTVSGTTVTYSGIPSLSGGEEVVIKYFEDLSIISNPGLPDVLMINNITDGYNIDFGNNTRGINALDPINAQDLATKAYVDAVAGFQNLAQVLAIGNSAAGYNIDLALSSRVINSLDPVSPQDLATKSYVDGYANQIGLPYVLSINNDSDGQNILMSGHSAVQSPDASGTTQTLTIRTGDSTTGNCGMLIVRGGNTSGNANAGAVSIAGGTASTSQPSSAGGAITLTGGPGGLTGGNIAINGGLANTATTSSNGGSITLTSGVGYYNGSINLNTPSGTRPGNIALTVGTANTVGGVAGHVTITSGDSSATNVAGGYLTLRGGNSSLGNGGSTSILGGNGNTSGVLSTGGDVNITGGFASLRGGSLLLTGGNANTATSGSVGGSIILHPGDGEIAGFVVANIENTISDGYFAVLDGYGTGLHIGDEAITTASHNYALVWDQDGYNKYVPFPSGVSGYLGVDVFIRSLADFPTSFGGIITLAANTVYGIDGTIDIGTNSLVAQNGTKIVGGGGTSTTSAIITTSTLPALLVGNNDVTVDGLTIQNLGTGAAISIGADNFSIVDVKFVSAGNSAVIVSNPGLGQITDSFIYVPQNGSGIAIKQNATSFLVKNTKFKGVGTGYGTAINLDATSGTITIGQVVAEGCNFEDLGISIHQSNNVIVNGNLAAIGCTGTNINTFLKIEVGTVTQAAAVVNNIIWNCSLFSVGLVPGGNHVFRGNLMHGIAQAESPIV